jgi:hypothetical protein
MSTVLDAAAEMKADDAVEVDLEKLKFDDAEEGKGCSSHPRSFDTSTSLLQVLSHLTSVDSLTLMLILPTHSHTFPPHAARALHSH